MTNIQLVLKHFRFPQVLLSPLKATHKHENKVISRFQAQFFYPLLAHKKIPLRSCSGRGSWNRGEVFDKMLRKLFKQFKDLGLMGLLYCPAHLRDTRSETLLDQKNPLFSLLFTSTGIFNLSLQAFPSVLGVNTSQFKSGNYIFLSSSNASPE